MDFLEDLFGDRERRNRGELFQNGDRHDHHDDNHDDHDHHDDDHNDDYHQHQPYPTNLSTPQDQTNPDAILPGIVCRKCFTPTVQGAKFCHLCGAVIEATQNCASCGSKMPTNGSFCPQCGYKNG